MAEHRSLHKNMHDSEYDRPLIDDHMLAELNALVRATRYPEDHHAD
jgi:hypothetical protein